MTVPCPHCETITATWGRISVCGTKGVRATFAGAWNCAGVSAGPSVTRPRTGSLQGCQRALEHVGLALRRRAQADQDEGASILFDPRGLPCRRPDVLKRHPHIADIRWQRPRTKIKGGASHHQHPCRRIILLQRGTKRRQAALLACLIEGLRAIAPIDTLHHRRADRITESSEEPLG